MPSQKNKFLTALLFLYRDTITGLDKFIVVAHICMIDHDSFVDGKSEDVRNYFHKLILFSIL
jgi:hypothetical protein